MTLKNKALKFFKNKNNILILSLVLAYIFIGLLLQYKLISQFKSLPSPIYGGDYYYQLGSVNYLRNYGNPLKSSSMAGGMPGYLPMYGFLCGIFANIFGLSSISAMLYFSFVIFVVSVLLWLFAFNKIFKNMWLAAFAALIANSLNYFPVLKYTQFTRAIMIPLFVYALYNAYDKKSTKSYVLLAIFYSLLTLSHIVAFVGATIIIAMFAFYELYAIFSENKGIKDKEKLKGYFTYWAVFSLSALPIILLYWYRPIFVYHLYQVNHLLEWNVSIDFSKFSEQIKFLLNSIKSMFFNFKSLFSIFASIFSWIGLYYLYERRKDKLTKFSLIVLAGALIATFSYFITMPLLKINLVPNYMSYFYLSLSSLILTLLGIKYMMMFLRHKSKKYETYFLFFSFFAFVVFSIMLFNSGIKKNVWIKSAKSEIMPYYLSLADYLDKNSGIDDIILSTKELSFAVNAVSGRKVLVNRWAQQNDPYNSFSERDLAAAIILYGNNTEEKLKLIKKYNVKYLYWDYYWLNSEVQVKDKKIVGFYDPLLMFYNSEYEDILKKNNVSYKVLNYWVDPSIRDVKKFKLIIITPDNYYNATHPWKKDIDQYLKEVWHYNSNGFDIAKLYKIEVQK